MFPVLAGSNPSGYNLTRSLRFRSSASAYLNRTPASTTNRQIATYSGWIKRGALNSTQQIFQQGDANFNTSFIEFGNDAGGAGDFLCITDYNSSSYKIHLVSTSVYRDPSAWYHIVVAYDTTQATTSNRVKVWINNVQITSWTTADYPAQNATLVLNTTAPMSIGRWYTTSRYFDGYLTEINFIDGQALTPSSFGETDTTTGVWKPKRYAGTYGTNGFYLPFTDNSALTTSSNVGLGKDFSGNGNYWVTNNISITSGVTYDSMTDVPTLTSATAANFAVLNPLKKGSTLTISNGNLTVTASGTFASDITYGTIGITSGKWYWEGVSGSSQCWLAGIIQSNLSAVTYSSLSTGTSYAYGSDGNLYNGQGSSAFSSTYTSGDVVMCAFDATSGKVWFGKNGTWAASGDPSAGTNAAVSSIASSTWTALVLMNGTGGSTGSINFGQRPFTYTPPTGYVALNTFNLPTSTIVKGNTVFDVSLWTGNSTGSTTQTITNSGSMKPDFLWGKSRSAAYNHVLIDSVRGVNKILYSDLTNAEVTNANTLSSFNSNGFTVGIDAGGLNDNGKTFVGWQWQAGQGSTSSNTSGTITSTVSVNTSAGFSVVTFSTSAVYTGGTVGHGLGVAPAMYIVKNRNGVANINWITYHQSVGNTAALYLNGTNAATTSSTFWNNTSPTSNVFSIGANLYISSDMVAYCWAPIAGYSAFGSYVGNGSSDGPFVYTGFRPRWIMTKQSSAAGQSWNIFDTARNTYNLANTTLYADQSSAEDSVSNAYDILSNGFKLRTSASQGNTNGATYVYMAFAENPLKYALAR